MSSNGALIIRNLRLEDRLEKAAGRLNALRTAVLLKDETSSLLEQVDDLIALVNFQEPVNKTQPKRARNVKEV